MNTHTLWLLAGIAGALYAAYLVGTVHAEDRRARKRTDVYLTEFVDVYVSETAEELAEELEVWLADA